MRIGLDVGGTKTDAVAVTAAGEIAARVRLATAWGPDGVVRTIVDAVAALGAEPAVAGAAPASIGIGMPGQVAPGGTRVLHAVNLGVDELDLAAALGSRPGIGRVRIENDVKAAALGAYALRGRPGSMAYLYPIIGRVFKFLRRPVIQNLRLRLFQSYRGVHHDHAVGHLLSGPHIVRNDDAGHRILTPRAKDQFVNDVAHDGIEPGRRLVVQDDVGP